MAEPAGGAQDETNLPINGQGELPTDESGRRLNLDFERGNLDDWTPQGNAFEQQPIQGGIDPQRPFGEGKQSNHTGDFWLGGFERLLDPPTGTLTSAAFKVQHPWASFLVGGGSSFETRVELVRADSNQVFLRASGTNVENLRPVVVDLRSLIGQRIFVRVVDEHRGGWGHVNFDDFRVYDSRPQFSVEELEPRQDSLLTEVYPHAGLDADVAASVMQLPPGFSVQVGAAEPDVNQPIALALDDRGRVWIAEAYEYPRRAPDGEGKDRLLIFEDTDGDGTLDSRKVFAENLNLVSGFEIGFGGVFVGAAPYLLFIPDRDGDDVPDGEPEVLLDGWGYQDTHETLNAFIWGPDGWLYGCHGVFTHSRVGKPGTPDEQRVPINAGIWRYHPTKQEFEVFAYGTSNPWGVDFDEHGQAFATACVIPHLFHIIQGARYQRQAGAHFNPHVYRDIPTIAEHRHFVGNQWNDNDRKKSDELGGGHAHAGALIYQGGAWPEEYQGMLLMNNIHGNRLNMDRLSRQGSGFVGSRAPDFLLTGDKWSQMINMRTGPDGQMWVIDWYDANQCHRNENEAHDRTNGRVYRVVYQDAAPVAVDLASETDEQLVDRLSDPNDWYVRHARRLLQERAAAGDFGSAARQTLIEKFQNDALSTESRLSLLWAIHVTGGVPSQLAERLLNEEEAWLRAWTIQLLFENGFEALPTGVYERLLSMASHDSSQVVRLYLASAAQRVPLSERWRLLESLSQHPEDAADHNLPLMYWYASMEFADADPERSLAYAITAGTTIPQLREFMVRRIGNNDPNETLGLLAQGIVNSQDSQTQLTFLRAINEAVAGRGLVTPPAGWQQAEIALADNDLGREVVVRRLAVQTAFGDEQADDELLQIMRLDSETFEVRRLAIELLAKSPSPKIGREVVDLMAIPELRSALLNDLLTLAGEYASASVAAVYGELSLPQRKQAIGELTTRIDSAKQLLDEVERQRIPKTDLSADLVRRLRNLNDREVNERITKTWGVVRETSATVGEQMESYQRLLATNQADPDLELGRAVFAKTCQQCHSLFGSGGQVGPDLTGANRKDVEYLFSNILDPSAVMAKEYQSSVVLTIDGRVLTGIAKPVAGERLQIVTESQTTEISLDDVEEISTSEKSMMPEDLLLPLRPQEVRALVGYLQSDGQTPLLASRDNVNGFFNREDLAGWVGDESLWSVENGVIIGRSPGIDHNQFLVSEMALEDFRFSCDVRLVGDIGNSGIQFRSTPMSNGEVRGYQADIGAGWWGKLYEELGRGLLVPEGGEEFVNQDDWNRYEIVAVGSRVQTWLNGRLCVDYDDPLGARRGVIALQLHAGGPMEVQFRELKLELIQTGQHFVDFPSSTPLEANQEIKFETEQLDDLFRSEGVTVADFNNDGMLDVAAGSLWYEAPDWTRHRITETPAEFNPIGYSNTFCNFAEDVNDDGRVDLIVVDFPGTPTWWFENPGDVDTVWTKHELTPVTNNESPTYMDLDGDGRRELVCGIADGHMAFATPQSHAEASWKLHPISLPGAPGTDRFSHGLGVGDINRDGRNDVLVPQGWWESPEEAEENWVFHPAPFGEGCSQMHVYDFDQDGDHDVVSSSAHNFGIWWHEQTEEGWTTHEIDRSFSQTHSLCLADINGDGKPDLVTGKRYFAHNGNDPGGQDPAVVFWFELGHEDGQPVWTPHQIDRDSGVGTQFEVIDIDRDGDLDVVTSNKKGVFVHRQQR